MIGSILAQWAAVAVVGMFLFGLGAALLATRKAIGFVEVKGGKVGASTRFRRVLAPLLDEIAV